LEVAEFAEGRGIADMLAFVWWVPYTMQKRDVILAAIKFYIRKTTHKYGIKIPTSIKHGNKIDKINDNTFWRDALTKEMHNVGIIFEILLNNSQKTPVGWSKVTGHHVWDVKIDFTWKARWVLDGHRTPDLIGSTYVGVVSRESVPIAFTYAPLNGLDVCAANI
jgi:hypothetical protein